MIVFEAIHSVLLKYIVVNINKNRENMNEVKSGLFVYLFPDLFLPAPVGEPLLQKSIQKFLLEQQQVSLELQRILDAPGSQVFVNVLVIQLTDSHIGQVIFCLRQHLWRASRVNVLKPKLL